MAKQKVVEINNGKDIEKYTLQHPGIGWYMDIADSSKDENGNPRQGFLYREYLKNIVVDPVVKLEDFDDMENGFTQLSELMGECERFLTNQK